MWSLSFFMYDWVQQLYFVVIASSESVPLEQLQLHVDSKPGNSRVEQSMNDLQEVRLTHHIFSVSLYLLSTSSVDSTQDLVELNDLMHEFSGLVHVSVNFPLHGLIFQLSTTFTYLWVWCTVLRLSNQGEQMLYCLSRPWGYRYLLCSWFMLCETKYADYGCVQC